MTPYYQDSLIELYHGDALQLLPLIAVPDAVALVTDPPYGDSYRSNAPRLAGRARSIVNDADTSVRDGVLDWWANRGPALVFGTWKVPRPADTKMVLVWDKGGALGMGDLTLPWKPDHEEIYVLGGPWAGRRDCGSVVRCAPVQAVGRDHPNEKPVELMRRLLEKIDPSATIVDPTCGVGSTLVAAKALGRRAIGIELDSDYCAVAAERLGGPIRREDGAFDFGGAA